MEIDKMLTISTIHISTETIKKLNRPHYLNELSLSIYDKAGFGWFIFVPNNLEIIFNNGEGIPNDLWECLLLANHNECNWLCLDADGEEVPGLETYE